MSKNIYCPNCGASNDMIEGYKRPNFCTSCSHKFAWSSVPTPPKQTQPAPVIDQEDEEDEEDYQEPIRKQSFSKVKPFVFEFDIPENSAYTIKSLSQIKEPLVDLSVPQKKLTKKQIKDNLIKLQERVRTRQQKDID